MSIKETISGNNIGQSSGTIEDISNLREKFGTHANIPEDELTRIGYVRNIGNDGILTIRPLGLESKSRTLEDKNNHKPFERFSVEIKDESNEESISLSIFRKIKPKQLTKLIEDIDAVVFSSRNRLNKYVLSDDQIGRSKKLNEDLTNIGTHNYGERSVHNRVLWSLTEFYPMFDISEEEIKQSHLIYKNLNDLFSYLNQIRGRQDMIINNGVARETINDDEDIQKEEVGATEIIKALSSYCSGVAAKYADIPELYKILNFNIGFDTLISEDETFLEFLEYNSDDNLSDDQYEQAENDAQNYIAQLSERGIDTEGKLLMLIIGEYLDDLFPGVRENSFANETLQLNSAEEVSNYLKTLNKDLLSIYKNKRLLAKEALNHISPGQEGRTQAEQEVSRATQAMKDSGNKILPLQEAFDRPYQIAKLVNKKTTEIQKMLNTNKDCTLTFVSDIDEIRDANPGVISGDCTINNPLPFLESNNNLYNVKVFEKENHCGNIYLLVINDKNGKPVIWHMDAIQIPKYLNWNIAASKILEGFKQSAKENGIKMITVNTESVFISNYDYIYREFEKLILTKPVSYKVSRVIDHYAEQLGLQTSLEFNRLM
jgi:hypothetical protein